MAPTACAGSALWLSLCLRWTQLRRAGFRPVVDALPRQEGRGVGDGDDGRRRAVSTDRLEYARIIPRSYSFSGDEMMIRAQLVGLREVPAMVFLNCDRERPCFLR